MTDEVPGLPADVREAIIAIRAAVDRLAEMAATPPPGVDREVFAAEDGTATESARVEVNGGAALAVGAAFDAQVVVTHAPTADQLDTAIKRQPPATMRRWSTFHWQHHQHLSTSNPIHSK